MPEVRRDRSDRLYPGRPLGPREREAVRLVEGLPGALTIVGLAHALDIPVHRVYRLVDRLESRGLLRRSSVRQAPPRKRRAASK